jgi:hypothetical protein
MSSVPAKVHACDAMLWCLVRACRSIMHSQSFEISVSCALTHTIGILVPDPNTVATKVGKTSMMDSARDEEVPVGRPSKRTPTTAAKMRVRPSFLASCAIVAVVLQRSTDLGSAKLATNSSLREGHEETIDTASTTKSFEPYTSCSALTDDLLVASSRRCKGKCPQLFHGTQRGQAAGEKQKGRSETSMRTNGPL